MNTIETQPEQVPGDAELTPPLSAEEQAVLARIQKQVKTRHTQSRKDQPVYIPPNY